MSNANATGAAAGRAATSNTGNKAPAANHAKLPIDVIIDGHFHSKVYTSGSTIAGRAVLQPTRDVSFDFFDIVFTGIAATRLDFVQQYPSHSFRPFMKLRMPLSEIDLPENRVFKAGQTYTVPFHFVVPHHLAMGACKHQCDNPAVIDQHLRMPPSVGFWGADDQAPEMAQVEYAVKARVIQGGIPGGPAATKAMEGQHVVKVLPATPEDAPLDITFRDERYTQRKSKTIRKNLFSAKTGRLSAASSQPGAIMLSADGRHSSASFAQVGLEYVPDSADTAPPKINSVTGKLVSTTFFGAAPANHLPNLGPRTSYHSTPCLNYVTTNSLFSSSVDKVSWTQGKVSAVRRDSGYSSSHMDDVVMEADAAGQSKKSNSPFKHTASLEIPFTVSNTNRKFFLPTFHSCLISRTYTLQLTLSVGPTNTTMTLNLPLQIGVETLYEPHGAEELPSFESVMAQTEEAEADNYLRPRIRRLPSEEAPQSNSLLPGYDELRNRARAVPVA